MASTQSYFDFLGLFTQPQTFYPSPSEPGVPYQGTTDLLYACCESLGEKLWAARRSYPHNKLNNFYPNSLLMLIFPLSLQLLPKGQPPCPVNSQTLHPCSCILSSTTFRPTNPASLLCIPTNDRPPTLPYRACRGPFSALQYCPKSKGTTPLR